ncbi:RraA-like protein [Zopfochytrium polystomum]|nr:RraA-like protein [Zopfochytrium polystomum]
MTKLGITCYIQNTRLLSPPPSSRQHRGAYFIGPAHTVQFVPHGDTTTPAASAHHVDTLTRGSVMVIAASASLPNAVWGGLMTARARRLGCVGAVVDGRVRDLNEIWGVGEEEGGSGGSGASFPVLATRGTSVLGAGSHARPVRVGEPVTLCGETAWPVVVREGDVVVGDVDGAVRVPIERAAEVGELARRLKAIDAQCLGAVEQGSTLVDAFRTFRGKK